MKRFLAFVFILMSGISLSQKSSTDLMKAEQLNSYLSKLEKDSIVKLEILSAKYFHEYLNTYRLKKRKKTLEINDTLWLCSRNHAIWMMQNDKVGHTQTTASKKFSGKTPKDRLKYCVGKDVGSFAWGENALYNSNSGKSTTMDEWAKKIAKICLDQWIASPDHHKNMISNDYNKHGFAVVIDENHGIYACDFFVNR
jgi:uncharacterized protein YkwD